MNHVILQKAFQSIIAFNNIIISESLPWKNPHVTYTIHDEICFEWWDKERKITIYIEENETSCIKSWGENMHSDMEDWPMDFAEDFLNVWRWLYEY